jgi:hypothetical protein
LAFVAPELAPVDHLGAPHAAGTIGIGPDDAGIDREAFASNQASLMQRRSTLSNT